MISDDEIIFSGTSFLKKRKGLIMNTQSQGFQNAKHYIIYFMNVTE